MNDFLQNLRGSSHKEKRTPKTRRGFDNGNQYNNPAPGFQGHGNYPGARGGGNIKRPAATRATAHSHMPGGEPQPPYLSMDPTDIMVELMDIYTKNQELLINIQERRVVVEERKAAALEGIAEYIREATSSPELKDILSINGEGRGDVVLKTSVEKKPSEAGLSNSVSEAAPEPAGDERRAHLVDAGDFGVAQEPCKTPCAASAQPVEPALDLSSDSVDDADVSVAESQIASGKAVRKIREKSVKRTEAEPAPSQSDDLFPIEKEAAPKTEAKEAFLRKKRAPVKTQQKKTPKKASKKLSVDSAKQQSVTVIKRKKNHEKTDKDTGSVKDKNVAQEGLLPREEVMTIIHSMREKGATFDQVAQHLVDLGQPTFSGRGEWHAQTIHRLCNKKEKKKKK